MRGDPGPHRRARRGLLLAVLAVSLLAPAGGALAGAEPPAGRYAVRASDSYVGYQVHKLGLVPIRGSFGSVAGDILLDPDAPERCRVAVQVPLASLQSGNERRTSVLLSEDFFHAARHPAMRFESTRVRRTAGGAWLVTGELTIRGVSRTLTVPVSVAASDGIEGPVVVFSTELAIDRTDFGVLGERWSGGRALLSDRVEIELALTAERVGPLPGGP